MKRKYYDVLRLPEIDLKKVFILGSCKCPLKSFWWVDYSPWLMYKNAFFEDSMGVVMHFVIGDN